MLEQIIAKIYGLQEVKEGPYEKFKLEEWGHGSARVNFSNDGSNEEPTIQLNLTSNSQHSSVDLEIIEAATQHVDRYRKIGKSIRSVFKFIGIAVLVPILVCLLLYCLYCFCSLFIFAIYRK